MATNQSTCCEILAYYLERECPTHPDPWACLDRQFYPAPDGEIGIVVRDFAREADDEGPETFATMRFCPYCASPLPLSTLQNPSGASGADPLRRIDLGSSDDQG